MSQKLLLEIICYAGTLLTLVSYCFRTLKLRIFLTAGNVVNIVWAVLANQTPIFISNILYLAINLVGLLKEIRVNEMKKKFRSLNPIYKDGMYWCLDYSAKTEKELISILKESHIL